MPLLAAALRTRKKNQTVARAATTLLLVSWGSCGSWPLCRSSPSILSEGPTEGQRCPGAPNARSAPKETASEGLLTAEPGRAMLVVPDRGRPHQPRPPGGGPHVAQNAKAQEAGEELERVLRDETTKVLDKLSANDGVEQDRLTLAEDAWHDFEQAVWTAMLALAQARRG